MPQSNTKISKADKEQAKIDFAILQGEGYRFYVDIYHNTYMVIPVFPGSRMLEVSAAWFSPDEAKYRKWTGIDKALTADPFHIPATVFGQLEYSLDFTEILG